MLRRQGKLESKEQKLLNLLVAHYLAFASSDQTSDAAFLPPLRIPVELEASIEKFNGAIRRLGHFPMVTFRPIELFPECDLKKLQLLRQQLLSVQGSVNEIKTELNFQGDAQISKAHREYMELLHRYNDVKDITQALLGRLAQLSSCTTKDLYPQFNLSFED